MKYVLWFYSGFLVVLLVASVVREGFESSPKEIKDISNKKVLLLVTMKGCGHCEALKPAWKAVSAKHPGQMISIDSSDSSPEAKKILDELDVKGYPAMFIMDHGKMVKTYEGGRTEQDLTAEVASL